MSTDISVHGNTYRYGTAAERAAMPDAPFNLRFVETDTAADAKCYIGTGNGVNWLGPYTAADVGLGGGGGGGSGGGGSGGGGSGGGGSSGVVGDVLSLPSAINQGGTKATQTFSSPVRAVVINVQANSATTSLDAVFQICFDAANDALASSWLDRTVVGKRIEIKPADGPVEVSFNGDTISRVDYLVNATAGTLNASLAGVL